MEPIILKYSFDNFKEALEFINKVGAIAEELNHHPNIKLYNYKEIEFEIYTHSENKVTEKDLELKKAIIGIKGI